MILTFYSKELNGTGQYGPAYCMPYAATPVSVKIHAAEPPTVDDATFEIYDDGVSIMANHAEWTVTQTVPPVQDSTDTSIMLEKNQSDTEIAEDFNDNDIEEGSWVTCIVTNNGGGKGFTVQLEVELAE